jgi:hypothetical protein
LVKSGRAESFLLLSVVFLLGACSGQVLPREFAAAEDPELAAAVDQEATPAAFAACRGYGCGLRELVGLDIAEQQALRALFEPAPADGAAERAAVSTAVALLEQSTGRALGTWADKPRTPMSLGDPAQMDCVDESINTSTALHLLNSEGLLKWHIPAHPARRYAFLHFGVHYTAVLEERASGQAWAVDSWFHANGVPAEVVELERWRAGWRPESQVPLKVPAGRPE